MPSHLHLCMGVWVCGCGCGCVSVWLSLCGCVGVGVWVWVWGCGCGSVSFVGERWPAVKHHIADVPLGRLQTVTEHASDWAKLRCLHTRLIEVAVLW